MPHIVVLGLVLTLVAGVFSFAVLVRKIHGRPSSLPSSIPTPLLLYNLWIAAWLVSQYLALYLYPTLARPVQDLIRLTSGCAISILSLAWLRAHVVLVDQFLQSDSSARASRVVSWFAVVIATVLVTGCAVTVIDRAFVTLFAVASELTGTLLFPLALAASVMLAVGARRKKGDPASSALTVLAYAYVSLFALLAALVLVPWARFGVRPPVLLSADLVLELAYNVLMVIWVARYADAFTEAAACEVGRAQGFDALCESFKISKREREIVELICEGLTNRQIANRLFISQGTVKDHNYTIFQKAGVRNRTQLAQLFTRAGEGGNPRRAASGIRRVV